MSARTIGVLITAKADEATLAPVAAAVAAHPELTLAGEGDPDLLVVAGGARSTLARVVDAGVPLAHVGGGETTGEDGVAHALTMLSHLHFPATADAERRILRLGEEEWRVERTGAPRLDTLHALGPLEPVRDGAYLLVTCDDGPSPALAAALDEAPVDVVLAHPARDGAERYFALLAHAAAVAGDSAYGIVEAAAYALPAVDVGPGRSGWVRGENVLTAIDDPNAIAVALEEALDPGFRASLEGMENPYGDGRAAPRIAAALARVELGGRLLAKRFVDR